MDYPAKYDIPYEGIDNGALILLILRECDTWEELCKRYAFADAGELATNTCAMALRNKLFKMRDLGLLDFAEDVVGGEKKPVGKIQETALWTKVRSAMGGMSLDDAAMISRHSNGMAVTPVFGRPRQQDKETDIFVLMPFNTKLQNVYTEHIKRLGEELGLTIRRADHDYSPTPFMDKVWSGICGARLVIADCTERNPNVFYEIGIAHTVGKQVVLITRSEEDIPSDIKHYDFIPYIYDPEGIQTLVEKLRTFITQYFKLSTATAEGVTKSDGNL
jgi:hypothetical protein